MLIYICQGKVALDNTKLSEIMNKQRILKSIGIIFLLITISVETLTGSTSGQQKNNSTIEQLNTDETFTVYARGTSYLNCDPDSAAGRTSSLIPIKTVKSLGLQCIAVDPEIIPYGSVIIGRNKNGREIVGVAVDTGGDVKNRKAARMLAIKKGFGKNSPEYKAIVLDFHAHSDITRYWDTFTVIPYQGPDFKFELKSSQRLAHLKAVKEKYL